MAILNADPLDQYGGSEAAMVQGPWAQVDTGSWNLSNANPRTGAWALRCVPVGTHLVRRVFGNSLAEGKVAFAMYCDALPSSENPGDSAFVSRFELCSFRDAANNVQVVFVFGTNGQVVAYRGQTTSISGGLVLTTLLDRSDPLILIPARAYSHLEFKVGIDDSAGYCEVRLNGVTIMNLTGIDTRATGAAAETSQWAVASAGADGGGVPFADFCDFIFSDDAGAHNPDFVGDQKVYWLPPDSDTAQADWTPSTGSTSYGVIDEAPPNDADYLSLAATTGKTNVGCADLPADVVSVSAVIPTIRSWKDDAGVCDLAPGILQGATYDSGSGQPQTTAPNYYHQVFEVDPVSGVPFTPAEVNSLKLVLERTA